MLRIGFVGSGLIAWAHAIGLRSMIEAGVIDAQIVAAYDEDRDRAEGFARANDVLAATSVDELLQQCDAVWVCTPTAAHSQAVELAATVCRAVFCEKPLSTDLAGARSMAESVDRAGIPVQVGLVLRSTPVFRTLRQLATSGDLGSPMAVIFRDDQFFPVQGHYSSKWRADSKMAGGGCLIEHSIHDLDILRFCFGEVEDLACRTANLSGTGDVEDVASVSLRFKSGAIADLTSVWHDITSRGSSRRVEIFFERGFVWLDDDFLGPLHVERPDGKETVDCPSPPWVTELPLALDEIGLAVRLYVEADRAFVDAVIEGRTPVPGFEDAVVAHELVDAAYRSAAMGGVRVAIPQ